MAILQRLARLTNDVLYVEAGATAETTIEVEPFQGVTDEEVREYGVHVRGLPTSWYSVSSARLRLASGEPAEVLLVVHPPRQDSAAPLGEYEFVVELVPAVGDEPIALPARLVALAPGAATMRSRFLQYLPSVYQDDLFLARFLLIFQSVLDPIEQMVDNTHSYLDPGLTPAAFLPWLAQWVGETFEPGLDEARKRELIQKAVELRRWKGTRRGMREELKIHTGTRPLIVENFDGMRVGQDAALGLNTQLGAHRLGDITVTLAKTGEIFVDQQGADALVEDLKPAQVGHVVRIVQAPMAFKGGSDG